MIDWVEVVRRLLALYKVKTQRELGMALGMPIDLGAEKDIKETGISWKILAKAVEERKVRWDWLLEGRGDGPKTPDDEKSDAASPEDTALEEEKRRDRARLPRIETRELERTLLNPEEPATEPCACETSDSTAVIQELEDIKETMEKEIDRVNRLLGEKEAGSQLTY